MATNPPEDKITKEQYDLQRVLFRIREDAIKKGKRHPLYNLLRNEDFKAIVFAPLLRGKKFRRTNADIKPAVNLWCTNPVEAEERYGHISEWDVSRVTDMTKLFKGKAEFNDDIRQWDVSNVTTMIGMFCDAHSFNQAIGGWDVSKVTNMDYMFCLAENFNQQIGAWDVSHVTSMSLMFNGARNFNQQIGAWDVSHVINAQLMFADCPISNANKPARFRGGGAKNRRRASRKGTRSRKGRRTLKRGTRRRTRRR